MKPWTKLDALFDRIIGFLALLAGILVIFIMIAISSEVVTRYFLNRPIGGVLDLTQDSILWICFLSAAWLGIEGHVSMDFVFNMFRQRQQAWLTTITSAIGSVICLGLTCYGVWVTWDSLVHNIREVGLLEIPTALVVAVIPVGLFLLFIQFLRKVLESWRKLKPQRFGGQRR